MSKKKDDHGLLDAIADIMGQGKDMAIIDAQNAYNVDTNSIQTRHNVDTKRPRHVRIEPDDLEALDRMAKAEGTTASALIRRAIKDLLRKGR